MLDQTALLQLTLITGELLGISTKITGRTESHPGWLPLEVIENGVEVQFQTEPNREVRSGPD